MYIILTFTWWCRQPRGNYWMGTLCWTDFFHILNFMNVKFAEFEKLSFCVVQELIYVTPYSCSDAVMMNSMTLLKTRILYARTQKWPNKWTNMKGSGEWGKRQGGTLKNAASGPFFSYTLLDLPMAIIIPCMLGVIIAWPGSRNHVKQNNRSL